MGKNVSQNLKNHNRFDPLMHAFVLPVAFANLVIAIVHLVRHPHFYAAWLVVLSAAALVLVFKVRLYPMKVQDRVIRLEERLRLRALAPAEWSGKIDQLSEDQLIGLRFAGDDQVVELAGQALEQKMNRKQIKEHVRNWRGDHWRV